MRNSNILHCLGSINYGLSSRICQTMIKAIGASSDHTIVGVSSDLGLSKGEIRAHYPNDFPRIDGAPLPGRLTKLAQAMAPYDLVLTYDYGALNVAMAHTAFSQAFGLPPLIHHEFGFGEAGLRELTGRRNWYRRISLGRAAGLVVPSERLEGLALTTWQQPIGRVKHVSPGVSANGKPRRVAHDALRGLIKRDGEQWIGTLSDAQDPSVWRLTHSALVDLPENWHLVVGGEGSHLEEVRRLADRMDLSHRVHLPGAIADTSTFLGLLDIYLELDESDAFPLDALRAAASGLPVVGIGQDTLRNIVSEANVDLILAPTERQRLPGVIVGSAQDMLGLVRASEQNREKAMKQFSEKAMVDRLKRLYASALGREL